MVDKLRDKISKTYYQLPYDELSCQKLRRLVNTEILLRRTDKK